MANFYGNDADNFPFGSFDTLYGGNGNDLLVGNALPNEVYGGQGNDVLLGGVYTGTSGTGSPDNPYKFLNLQASGNDYIEGGSGNDFADGGDGDDVIYGGDGSDSGIIRSYLGLYFEGGLFGGSGNDFIDGGNGNDLLDGESGDDALLGGYGSDTVLGGSGKDEIAGGFGNDVLSGGDDDDSLYGDAGFDVLNGGAGRDFLHGGADRDFIIGGLGGDYCTGGSGRDLFVYNFVNETGRSSSTRDQILDFERRRDDIDLRGIDANTNRGGNNKFKFIGDDQFNDRAGELRVRDAGAHVIVQGDVNGDGRKDFEILVRNVDTLSKSDFLL